MTSLHQAPVGGATRVASGVLDQLATVAASDVHGVLDTQTLVGGALVGGVIGGALGLAQAGPAGVALGAPLGASAGAVVAHWMAERNQELLSVDAGVAPPVVVHVVARYGEDLGALADRVRQHVEHAIKETLGLTPGLVTVEVVDVANPEEHAPPPLPSESAAKPPPYPDVP